MPPGSTRLSESCRPAPYGRACEGCSRAKHKCFYRAEGSECERCNRLGIPCEPSRAVRKRKAPVPPPVQPPSSSLEGKIDDIVSLLRAQASGKQTKTPRYASYTTPRDGSTPRAVSASAGHVDSESSTLAQNPDVAIDTAGGVVHILRPSSPDGSPSTIHSDISAHKISEEIAAESLDTFRRAFVPLFPFVHIQTTTSALELRRDKPFLWFVIMALTSKAVVQQFRMEETIWYIISKRVVSQHFASLDLLLGLISFASWSHYFKQDKPFMVTITQLAVSLAFDLGLQKDVAPHMLRHSNSIQRRFRQPAKQQTRTIEERRTMIALFHLTSSTWAAYRKTEPLRWTPYMDSCLRILCEGTETPKDIVLVAQMKCHIITNQLTCPPFDIPLRQEGSKGPTSMLSAALLSQLSDIQQSLPVNVASQRYVQFYLYHTELSIRESTLIKTPSSEQNSLAHFRRIEDLNLLLTCIERWMAVLHGMPFVDWVGITVDTFAHFTHCLVVLFKLTTLDEPGWVQDEVKRRADVFQILDRSCEAMERGPEILGIVDSEGPRKGLLSKAAILLRGIKALLLAEMTPKPAPNVLNTPESFGSLGVAEDFVQESCVSQTPVGFGGYGGAADFAEETPVPYDFLWTMSDEPWLSDLFESWNNGSDIYTSFE